MDLRRKRKQDRGSKNGAMLVERNSLVEVAGIQRRQESIQTPAPVRLEEEILGWHRRERPLTKGGVSFGDSRVRQLTGLLNVETVAARTARNIAELWVLGILVMTRRAVSRGNKNGGRGISGRKIKRQGMDTVDRAKNKAQVNPLKRFTLSATPLIARG